MGLVSRCLVLSLVLLALLAAPAAAGADTRGQRVHSDDVDCCHDDRRLWPSSRQWTEHLVAALFATRITLVLFPYFYYRCIMAF